MLELPCDPVNRVDLVIVYVFSRFFHNVTHDKEQLKQTDVRLISATQDVPEGPHGGDEIFICPRSIRARSHQSPPILIDGPQIDENPETPQPFIAPAVMPEMNCRCRTTKSRTGMTLTRIDAAAMPV